jgi:hypothetical protein
MPKARFDREEHFSPIAAKAPSADVIPVADKQRLPRLAPRIADLIRIP